MAEERTGLKREKGTVRPRCHESRRRERDDDQGLRLDTDDAVDDDDDDDRDRGLRRTRRGPGGRPPLRDELGDLRRGGAYVAAEAVAMSMDIFSRVLRGVVDRAFDEDYSEPGDVLRGLTNEADLAVYDLVGELRRVPRRLDKRFDEGIRSPRADRGERARRDDDR
ncbi:MAG: hypothetical protein MUF54_07755 [Polyangiaceae bacterium]|jgi:hypothetical protein|nr:hypothetical protein [Polyangiaceae bacterium]